MLCYLIRKGEFNTLFNVWLCYIRNIYIIFENQIPSKNIKKLEKKSVNVKLKFMPFLCTQLFIYECIHLLTIYPHMETMIIKANEYKYFKFYYRNTYFSIAIASETKFARIFK